MSHTQPSPLIFKLQTAGFKITKLRAALLEIFSTKHQPLTLEELNVYLKDREVAVHRATLYREIDFLTKQKLIHAVVLSDTKLRYEWSQLDHHHHAVCLQCHKITDVAIDETVHELDELVASQHNFQVTRHTLEFFGLCSQCQTV
ncbi:MAG: Fur family transcriptional regulator [Patescibacteria group bacterium]